VSVILVACLVVLVVLDADGGMAEAQDDGSMAEVQNGGDVGQCVSHLNQLLVAAHAVAPRSWPLVAPGVGVLDRQPTKGSTRSR
jgi:hypothetical protein